MNVIAFNGSPRQKSNTALLIGEVFRELVYQALTKSRQQGLPLAFGVLHECPSECQEGAPW